MLRRLLIVTFLALHVHGCPASESTPFNEQTCMEVADHIEALCGEGVGSLEAAAQRYDCETFNWPHTQRSCVLGVATCDPTALDACDLRNRIWGCSEDNTECPPELSCDVSREQCAQCVDDPACDNGMLCLEGWCVRDSAVNRQLQELTRL